MAIRVYQTNYGRNSGNCLTACVASLLSLHIDAVPEFCVDGEWFKRLAEFCDGAGFTLMYWKYGESNLLPINALVIMLLKLKDTDELHAVIGRSRTMRTQPEANGDTVFHWEMEIVHDPNQQGCPPVVGVDGYIAIWPADEFSDTEAK